jgi:pimeloyl-ACP methyl ester carboxylesterase
MIQRIARFALLPVFLLSILHAEDFFFDSAGVRIHYTVEGQGEPVILIPGYSASIVTNWEQPGIVKGLADRYQVVAIDNRGHGQSEKPHDAQAYGLNIMDEDVLHLMDHLNIRKAHVVGYSMGGMMTLLLLTQHPDRLLTATMGGAGWQSAKERQAMAGGMNQLADSLEQGKGLGPLIVALTPTGQPPPTPEQTEAASKRTLSRNDPLALAAVARGVGSLPVITEAQIRANKVPALALIGEQDALNRPFVDHLEGVMPNLKIVVIPGASHMTAVRNPEFLKALKAFLAEHSATAAATAAAN